MEFCTCVIITGVLLMCAACITSAADQPTGSSDLRLPPDFFPILPWDPLHGWEEPAVDRKGGLEGIADCGFTIAGFVQPRDLPLCEKLGLTAIMAPAMGKESWFGPWRQLTDEQIDERVQAMVKEAGDSKAVIGFFLTDEPGTPMFPKLARAVAAIRKYAPGKIAYINLFPSYATVGAPDASQLGAASYAEYLERFVTEVKPQFISYDNYMVEYSNDLRDPAAAAVYYNDLLEVRRVALKHDLPFWNIVSANQLRLDMPPPSPANMAFQAYTTLAAGGRGVSWYTYFGSTTAQRAYDYAPVDHENRRTATWGYLRMINHQIRTLGPMMNKLVSTGVYFTSPPPVEGLPLLPGKIVESVDSQLPIMVGEFTGPDSTEYAMVVNLSVERTAHIALHVHMQYKSKDVISAEDGRRAPLDSDRGLWLAAGQGVLLELK